MTLFITSFQAPSVGSKGYSIVIKGLERVGDNVLLFSAQYSHLQCATRRGSVRRTRVLGPNITARGQSIGISIGMLPQTPIMSITVQKTSKYYTTEFDLEEGF